MALVLSRYPGQSLIIKDTSKETPDEIVIKPYQVDGGLIRFYIEAPRHYEIQREELVEGTDALDIKLKPHGGNTNEN